MIRKRISSILILLVLAAVLSGGAISGHNASAAAGTYSVFLTPVLKGSVTTSSNPTPTPIPSSGGPSINRYDVLELTYSYPTSSLSNPWEQVSVAAVFNTPSGKALKVGGFYYDVNTYKVRFTPAEIGNYSYTVTFQGPSAPDNKTYSGSFTSLASANKGFVRKNPNNPYRFQFEDGSFFNGTGFNDCWYAATNLTGWIDAGKSVSVDTYMQTYSAAGFNLFRWNPANCGFGVFQTIDANGNTYLVSEGKMGDQLLSAAKKYGFHSLFTFFLSGNIPYTDVTNTQGMKAIERYMSYALARWGAYIDMWELTNETFASSPGSAWLQYFVNYLHTVDPYTRLVTNSHDQDQDWTILDFRGPHDWMFDGYHNLSSYTNGFTTNTPAMIGEGYQGTGQPCNWNSLTAEDLRTSTWTSIMSGLGLIWWATNGTKTYCGSPPNIYIGTEERGYVKVAQSLLGPMNKDSQFQVLPSSNTDINYGVKVYGLFSPTTALVYFFRNPGFTSSATTTSTTISVAFNGTASWIDPKTGNVLSSFAVSAGNLTVTTPSFNEDLVLKLASS